MLADFPLLDRQDLRGQARSPVCGSTLEIGLELDANGRITQIGVKLSACAVGQAAAALFARSALGQSQTELRAGLAEIEDWLRQDRLDLPSWPGFDAIAEVVDYPGRHGALVLPWKAALAALS